MDTEIIVAIILAVSTIVTAVVASYGATSRKVAISLAQISVKVDTLWEIYAEEAIRDARSAGMVATRSPEKPTEKFNDTVSNGLVQGIEKYVSGISDLTESPYDMAIKTWNKYSEELLIISKKEDISPRALFGAIYAICLAHY